MSDDYIKRDAAKQIVSDKATEIAINSACLTFDERCVYNDVADRADKWLDEVPAVNASEIMSSMWHIIKSRPMTEDEQREHEALYGLRPNTYEPIIYIDVPDDGQTVLVCYENGDMEVDTFYDDWGVYFYDKGSIKGVVAWMPLPQPPKEEKK